MAATNDDLLKALNTLITKIDAMLNIMKNAERIQIDNATVTDVTSQVHVASMTIPDGYSLTIESSSTNAGIIEIASKYDHNKVKRLRRGENADFRVKSTDALYITGNNAGDTIVAYAELK